MRKKQKKIELKLEMYSYFVDDRRGDKKKGQEECVIKQEIKIEDF